MLIDRFVSSPDAVEVHRIRIQAPAEQVYRALWRTDFGSSWIVQALLGVRALPGIILGRRSLGKRPTRLDLDAIIAAGFGKLAEAPERELVLGVVGRFWRPTGNLLPFRREAFEGPIPKEQAIAVWNFTLRSTDGDASVLETETRVACGDPASRRKFRLYWLLVRPFSGWIRRRMLVAVRRQALAVSEV